MPFFSIVIPIYNASKTLEETLKSIKDQSFQDFEVVMIDDGSTDESFVMASDWASKNSHLITKLIQQENKGLGTARNQAIEKCEGEFVALLDADDIWDREKLNACWKYIQDHKHEVDVLYHSARTFGLKNSRNRQSYSISTIADLLIKGNPIIPSATIIKRELFDQYTFADDRSMVEDLPLWGAMLDKGLRFAFLDQPLTLYREDTGVTNRIEEHLNKVDKAMELLLEQNIIDHSTLREARKRKHYEAGRFLHKRGRFSEARRHYTLSGRNDMKTLILRLSTRCGLAF